jgi:V/A-type H+-transporting ATPase subunit F
MDFFVLGESEVVAGFGLAGVRGRACTTRDDALAAFREMTGGQTPCRVLILTEDMSSLIQEEVLAWQLSGDYPLVVEVPALAGKLKGKKSMVDSIREAIGIQV